MSDTLAVWLYGQHVASLSRKGRSLRLAYTDTALSRYDLGVPVLSYSLPLRAEPFTHLRVHPFIEGMLPEGEPRQAIARDLGIPPDRTYALIEALGRDCAGALIIQPTEEPEPPPATTLTALRLSDEDLAGLVANLRQAPLGVTDRVRVSLAGVQEKLLLTRMPDGAWGQPVDGTPSTHILKPENRTFPSIVENEAFCVRFAAHLGLEVARIGTTSIDGRKLIVVERYDRTVGPDGSVQRIHQEDFCQANAVPPIQKYEDDGGPSLRAMAAILQIASSSAPTEELLRAVITNLLIGNGDAHGKNFSLLYEPTGAIRLAPLYDLISTRYYGDSRLAMRIDSVLRADQVTSRRVLDEAGSWGIPRVRASEILEDLLARVPEAVAAAAAETPGLPDELPQLVLSQLAQIIETEA